MKYVCALCAFLWLSGFSFVAQAQTPLQEMVKTEQAFSKMAEEKDTRDAFMAYIADLPIGGDVSRAGDLGYTHGTYEITDAEESSRAWQLRAHLESRGWCVARGA